MKAIAPLLLAIVLLPTTLIVSADVLLLDTIKQAHEPSPTVQHPTRGMSMSQVRQQFGEPKQEFPWVGEPPITRWAYDQFTVYFEHELVIETVVHRQ
jgi:hypothetical protein